MCNWLIKLLGGYTKGEYAILETTVSGLKEERSDMLIQYAKEHNELTEMELELGATEMGLAEAKRKQEEAQAELTVTKENAAKAQSETASVKAELTETKRKLAAKEAELAKTQAELAKAKKEFVNFTIAMDGVKVWVK